MKILILQLYWENGVNRGEKDKKESFLYQREKDISQSQNKGGSPYGQSKFITCMLEMPVSYCIHPQISKESTIWKLRNNFMYTLMRNMRRRKRNDAGSFWKMRITYLLPIIFLIIMDFCMHRR